jgi:hypothetical protein
MNTYRNTNMPRIRNRNKKPLTSMSIEEDLIIQFLQYKKFGERWTDFLRRIFNEWKNQNNLRQENQFLVDALEKAIKKNSEIVNKMNRIDVYVK